MLPPPPRPRSPETPMLIHLVHAACCRVAKDAAEEGVEEDVEEEVAVSTRRSSLRMRSGNSGAATPAATKKRKAATKQRGQTAAKKATSAAKARAQQSGCCPHGECENFKAAIDHIQTTTAGGGRCCDDARCRTMRRLLHHYACCAKDDCPVCKKCRLPSGVRRVVGQGWITVGLKGFAGAGSVQASSGRGE